MRFIDYLLFWRKPPEVQAQEPTQQQIWAAERRREKQKEIYDPLDTIDVIRCATDMHGGFEPYDSYEALRAAKKMREKIRIAKQKARLKAYTEASGEDSDGK
jgi:hypothetical protein